jgi:hypothetical protein
VQPAGRATIQIPGRSPGLTVPILTD